MNHLIIGYGEVGKAIHKVLGKADHLDNSPKWPQTTYDVLHICFPYSGNFGEVIGTYTEHFMPKLVIVHSTVPVGTCDKLGVVHSPIRGVHPNLAKGVKTFVKFFGGKDAKKAAKIFSNLGVKTKVTKLASNTEALKLWDTTQYGAMILLNKEIYAWCKAKGLDFDFIYSQGNKTYNEGYVKLNRKEVVRPYLKYKEGKIGGHCVVQNSFLLDSETALKLRDK